MEERIFSLFHQVQSPQAMKTLFFRYCIAGKGVFFMLLSTVKDEFVFHCQSRNLSPKTTKNYRKQIEYLLWAEIHKADVE